MAWIARFRGKDAKRLTIAGIVLLCWTTAMSSARAANSPSGLRPSLARRSWSVRLALAQHRFEQTLLRREVIQQSRPGDPAPIVDLGIVAPRYPTRPK